MRCFQLVGQSCRLIHLLAFLWLTAEQSRGMEFSATDSEETEVFPRLGLWRSPACEVHPEKRDDVPGGLESVFRNEHCSCLWAQKVLVGFLYVG